MARKSGVTTQEIAAADPREEKRRRRQAARQARELAKAKEIRSRRAARIGGCILGGLVILGLGFWATRTVLAPKPGTYVPSQGNAHIAVEPVGFSYSSDPPTSGPHFEQIAPWGIHERPIPKALQVHNLEDGGVLVQYNCTECEDLVSKLKQIVLRYPDKVILAPYPNMKARIALTAWSHIDAFDDFDEGRILRFIETHRGIDHHVRGRVAN
jgi:hypothetical protein